MRMFGAGAVSAPSTDRPVTEAPEKLPLALRPRVEAFAEPVTVVAVSTPLKTRIVPTCVVEVAVADAPEVVPADALIEPVVTTEPSAGYEKLEPNAAWSGGDEIEPALAPAWPGITTRTATARADPPAVALALPAPPAPEIRTRRPDSATSIVSRFPTVHPLSAKTAADEGFVVER